MEVPSPEAYSRRSLVRAGLALVVVLLVLPAAYSAATGDAVELGPGTVETSAEETTYVSVQGFHFAGYGKPKKPARLVAADGGAELEWLFDGDAVGAYWFYEVDPLEDGTLFVTSTYPDGTIVFEYDPETGEPVWTHDLPGILDTHSVAPMDDDRVLVANMRAYDGSTSHDRLYVVDRETGATEWEWTFHEHYDNGTDGGFSEDWTHVNDVEFVGDGERYVMASPRNFDQVIVIDRETDEIVMRLGQDGDHETLYEQHNPDYLERGDGTPVVLVADSENDRVVEYERDCGDRDPRLGAGTPPSACEWERVWAVDGFNWPRDADRLPNGNTLVTDSLNHRVVEVTPEGEVVWEFYAAWAPYDAERGAAGSDGPAMSDLGTTGGHTVAGGAERGPASQYHVADAISDVGALTPWAGTFDEFATTYAHVEPWFRPVGIGPWAFLSAVLGLLVAVGWGVGEVAVNRRRIAAGIRSRLDR